MSQFLILQTLILGLLIVIAVASIRFRLQHPEWTSVQALAAIPWSWTTALICIVLLGIIDWMANKSKQ